MDNKESLLILKKGQAISMKSFQKREKEFSLVPFLGFYKDYAGVGYIDSAGNEVMSNCTSSVERTIPIIRVWRAFQIIQRLDLLKAGMIFQVWDFVKGCGNATWIQELSSTGDITPSWCDEAKNSLPSDDFVVNIATQTVLANKWFDVDELRDEYARLKKEVPAIIDAYDRLMTVINSQNTAISRVKHSVMMEFKGVMNHF